MTIPLGTAYRDEDFPHGLRSKCHRLFKEPDRYSERLDGFIDDAPVTMLVCLQCALAALADGDAHG